MTLSTPSTPRARARPDKINVLFVHSQDGFGADSAIHAHIMRYLDRDRFSVHVACPSGNGGAPPASLIRFREIRDIRLRPMHFAPGFRHRSSREIAQQLRTTFAFPLDLAGLARYIVRERIHVVHGTDRPRDAVYAVGLGRLTGVSSIVHVHVAWSNGYSAPAKWGVRNASAVFSISQFVTETVVATGTPRSRISTILNGIDVARWDPQIDGSGVRREFGIPPDAPVLASVSRLFGQKGQRELLRALVRVRESFPEVRLLVVGADAVEVHGGSFTVELRALAEQLGIADRVIFTGPRTDVPQIMAACDVFTLPSFEEPFGLVYLEAMAMLRPVVAVDDGGTPEVVEHGRSGLLSPYGDIERLAGNIVTLLRDPEMRTRMGAYGRSRVVEYFNAQRMARDASAAYEAVVRA
jgi:glycosyltransferase involved in cell wall biosynthesis